MAQADLLRIIAALNRHRDVIDAARTWTPGKTTDLPTAMALALIDLADTVECALVDR